MQLNLYVWVNPYPVPYGFSLLFAVATTEVQRLPRPDNFNALCRSLDLDPLEVMAAAGYETKKQQVTRRLRKAA